MTSTSESPKVCSSDSNWSVTSSEWRVEHFSKLEYIEHKYVRFHLPKLWICSASEPVFDLMLIPSGYHSHGSDWVRFIIEHRRSSFSSNTDQASEVSESLGHKEVHFQLSFLDSQHRKCHTQEARLVLFKDPNHLYDPSVEMNIAYSYLLDPNNDLLHDDTLTILVEARIVDQIKDDKANTTQLKNDYLNYFTKESIETDKDVYYF